MCVSPVQIINRRIDFRPTLDKLYLTVPCGHCHECRQKKADDWFVRLYYEYKRVQELGGCVLFPTFTYNDESLPMIDLSNPKWQFINDSKFFSLLDQMAEHGIERLDEVMLDDGYRLPTSLPNEQRIYIPNIKVPTFQKLKVRNMFKKLRSYIENYLDGQSIKYFLVCEYGSQYHRAHYHALIFCDQKIDPNMFKLMAEYAWGNSIKKKDVPDSFVKSSKHFFDTHENVDFYAPVSRTDKAYNYIAHRSSDGKIRYIHKTGFVSYSPKYGAIVESISSLNYITKYVSKPQAFFDIPVIRDDFGKFFNQLPKPSNIDDSKLRDLVEELAGVYPFLLSSNGLGDGLFQEISDNIECSNLSFAVRQINKLSEKACITIPTRDKSYTVPSYILRKLLREDCDIERQENIRVTYNDPVSVIDYTKKSYITPIGKEVLLMSCNKTISRYINNYKISLSTQFIELVKHIATPSELELINSYENLYTLKDFRLMAIYQLFFQGLSTFAFDTMPSASDVLQAPELFIKANIATYNDVHDCLSSPFLDKNVYKAYSQSLFNDYPLFKGFDETLQFINILRNICRVHKLNDEQHKDFIAHRLKEIYYYYFTPI